MQNRLSGEQLMANKSDRYFLSQNRRTVSCSLNRELLYLAKRYNSSRLSLKAGVEYFFGSAILTNDFCRYNDIICIDATRVILRDRSSADDYIHASWMTMPDQYKYICTQGPLQETLEDFWHMMFCERSTVLVQLCNFVEGKHEKCSQYFPSTKGSTKILTMIGNSSFTLGQTMTVNHFSYVVWPDHTAPFDPAPMVGCLKLCKQLASGQPITVHCSAGIGRSATFVAIDYAWQKIISNGETKMIDVLKEVRQQRFHAIQSPIQYIFLHM
ncbi:unnamed protein product, partial [Nippostrongylus brasiliensis]|uniref:Protein-tyrosine phosphatase n=1 Tax=Nippostrongylus brasiliensis TaxID=27835 RepID=A0A0N4XG27_NIPBR